MLLTIIVFVAILAILVLGHELGHFVVARKNGIKVDEFGFGLPPRLFGVQRLTGEWRFVWGGGRKEDRDPTTNALRGGTVYSINLLPLGGFVKIKGEAGEFANDSDSFVNKKIWQRALVLSAGVVMNFILAGLMLSLGFGIGLPNDLNSVDKYARVRDAKVEVMAVLPNSPASQAGLLSGDEIVKVDNLEGTALKNLQTYTSGKENQPVRVVINRDGTQLEKMLTPVKLQQKQNQVGMGVALLESGIVSYPWYLAVIKGFQMAGIFVWEILKAFWMLIAGLFQGAPVAENLSGPVGVAVMTGRAARLGFVYLLQFTALLSVNLAVINFLPIPALDGGRILFLIVEKIRGRAVSQKIEQIAHTTGFALLMLLVLFVTFKDLAHFSPSLVNFGKMLIGK